MYWPSNSYGCKSNPWIVFIHGLFGDNTEWRPVVSELQDSFHCICVDLPGHGQARSHIKKIENFDHACREFAAFINQLSQEQISIYGYSMGGRISLGSMKYITKSIPALFIESASFGIENIDERKMRLHDDEHLLDSVNNRDEFKTFLRQWYRQDLFQKFSSRPEFANILEEKVNHLCIDAMKMVLSKFSVGRQEYISDWPGQSTFLSGKLDQKYSQLYREQKVNWVEVENADHNVHATAKVQVIKIINDVMSYLEIT